MKLSIIIPTYNASCFLTQTLAGVIGQTFRDWELLLIDDGSKDNTLRIAQEHAAQDSRIRVIAQENQGVAAARNRGIAEINPAVEYMIFLDHDDLWRPETLEILLAALESRPEAVGAHGLALPIPMDTQGEGMFVAEGVPAQRFRRKIIRQWGIPRVAVCSLTEPTTFSVQLYDGPVSTPGQMLVRRKAVERVGGFDPATTPCDDWDFWIRLSLLGPVVFVDKIVLNWRSHSGNASGSKAFMGHGVSQIRRKTFQLPLLTKEQKALAHWRYRRMYASVERHNAKDSLRWALDALSSRKYPEAKENLRRGLYHYRHYAELSLFWGKDKDRGPIPQRLSDTEGEAGR